jgi:TatD DNase family protein
MKFNYFDIHSHLNISPLLENKDEIINTMRQQGMGTITVGVDYDTSKLAVDFANENPDILWATVGQHPVDETSKVLSDSEWAKFKELARNDKVVAIGECGLDYFRLKGSEDEKQIEIERQKELFIKHIQLAVETGKPLMIHARPSAGSMNAYEDVLNILENQNFTGHANFHFFVGDIEIAKRIVGQGWTMSFDGPITFTNDYDDVIRSIPLENIMAETDAPFATPAPHRGQTNYPQYVEFVYKKIAQIKDLDPEIVRDTILNNIKRVFGISIDE